MKGRKKQKPLTSSQIGTLALDALTRSPAIDHAEIAVRMLESAKEELDKAITGLRDPVLHLGNVGQALRDAQSAIAIVFAADFPRMIAVKRAARGLDI